MSARTNVVMTAGVMILVMLSIGLSFYYTKAANDAVIESKSLIIAGQKNANLRGNITATYLDEILQQVVKNQYVIIGNLSQHRHVTNTTIQHLDNQLDEVLKLLGSNATILPDLNNSGSISSIS